jgi:cytochrome c556
MMRTALVVGTLLFGVGAVMAQQDVAVQQQNLMKSQGKNFGVLAKTVKGETPYDQAAIDNALKDLEASSTKITTTFATDPKESVTDANYASSPKIWQNKADFDAKVPPLTKAIVDSKGKIKDAASLKVAFDGILEKCTGCHETFRVKLK